MVSTEMNVEAGAAFSRLDGGAGYLLEHDGKEYVAWAVYDKEEDGKSVQGTLLERGKECLLIKVGGKPYVHTDVRYLNGLRLLEGYISVLNRCISKLERGMTQERCRQTLQLLQKQLSYAQQREKVTVKCAAVFRRAAETLSQVTKNQIYAKDLRYVLCQMADGYTQLTEKK